VPADLLLGEDELALGDDVELALLALDRPRVEAVLVQLGRETRGPFVVAASDGAVEDLDLQAANSRATPGSTARPLAVRYVG